jgi:hypothetical protein
MNVKRWLPIGLCCLPGVALVALIGIRGIAGGATVNNALQGPLGLGLIGLAVVACPLSMGLVMLANRNKAHADKPENVANCCLPDYRASTHETDRLVALRTRREALEHEIADLRN